MRLALFGCLFLLSSCTNRFLLVDNVKSRDKYIAQIENYNNQVHILKASLDIKAKGILHNSINEQADIVVQSPHYLYWSLRSFFGPPSLLLASDGRHITMYDFTSGDHAYQIISLSDHSFFDLIDFRFHPSSLINLLLAKIPLNMSSSLSLRKSDSLLEVITDQNGDWESRTVYDLEQNLVLETRLVNKRLNVSYHVKYGSLKECGGIYFPSSLVLSAKSGLKFAQFTIDIVQMELNGSPIPPEIFYIKPH